MTVPVVSGNGQEKHPGGIFIDEQQRYSKKKQCENWWFGFAVTLDRRSARIWSNLPGVWGFELLTQSLLVVWWMAWDLQGAGEPEARRVELLRDSPAHRMGACTPGLGWPWGRGSRLLGKADIELVNLIFSSLKKFRLFFFSSF